MANSSQNSLGEPALCSSSSHWEESPERVNSELDDTSPEGFTPAPSFSSVNMCISTSSMTSEEALCYDPQSFAGHFGNEDANIDTYYSKLSPFGTATDGLDVSEAAFRQLPKDVIDQWHRNHSYTNLPPTHRTPINSHSTLDKAVPVQDFNENIEMVDAFLSFPEDKNANDLPV